MHETVKAIVPKGAFVRQADSRKFGAAPYKIEGKATRTDGRAWHVKDQRGNEWIVTSGNIHFVEDSE